MMFCSTELKPVLEVSELERISPSQTTSFQCLTEEEPFKLLLIALILVLLPL